MWGGDVKVGSDAAAYSTAGKPAPPLLFSHSPGTNSPNSAKLSQKIDMGGGGGLR